MEIPRQCTISCSIFQCVQAVHGVKGRHKEIAQIESVKFLNNGGNFPREKHRKIGALEGLKLDKCWARFNQSGKEIFYTHARCAQA